MLLEAGHDVTAMTRREDRAAALREAGAVPVVCDVFDADGLARRRCERAQPEVVVHELTDLPPALDPRKLEEQAAGNDRIRTEGTRNLVAAAVAAGARRIVAQSIAFAYPPTGAGLKHEDDPLWDDAPWPWKRSVEALHELEEAVTKTEGIEGLVLRYGFFYGPGSAYGKGGFFEREVRRRRFPIVGRGSGVFSFIHVDDAADATVAAVERGAPGIYNIVDDEPAPWREWLPVYADAIGAKRPWRVPRFLARILAGEYGGHAGDRRCAVPRTSARRPSSAGSRATRAGGRGSGSRWASGAGGGVLAPQLLHALGPRAHRLVAELAASAGDVDRALLRREPVGEARDRRVAGAAQQAPDALRGSSRDACDSGAGVLRSGGVTPCVPSSSVTNSRKTTGSPSVTK